jgi:hypothetical protein
LIEPDHGGIGKCKFYYACPKIHNLIRKLSYQIYELLMEFNINNTHIYV